MRRMARVRADPAEDLDRAGALEHAFSDRILSGRLVVTAVRERESACTVKTA
jgi:hypothetical protein